MDVGSLISGSSAFSKSWLNIWKFSVHALLKPSLENFEHYLASMWNESNYAVVWTFFGIAFLWEGMKTELSQSCSHCWVFQIYWYTDSSNFKASSFRIINRSAEIPSPPLALFVVMLPKTHLTSHFRISGSTLSSRGSLVLRYCYLTAFCYTEYYWGKTMNWIARVNQFTLIFMKSWLYFWP